MTDKERLKRGNEQYVASGEYAGDVSEAAREEAKGGQEPYAVIVTCSDSRVIPEAIFSAGIGDLFVIRVAGNVIDKHQLGSIEYAAEHLGAKTVVVLGHTGCGAVNAALFHDPEGYVRYITQEIKRAVGKERDPLKACVLNVERSVNKIKKSLTAEDLVVEGAVYDIVTGRVEFLKG